MALDPQFRVRFRFDSAFAIQVPLNVMEDRLLGSVDVEESVKEVGILQHPVRSVIHVRISIFRCAHIDRHQFCKSRNPEAVRFAHSDRVCLG